MRYRIPVGSPKRRLFWQFVVVGSVIGAGCHTLLILIVAIGLVLAPERSRLGSVGVGLVLGALASPALWLAIN